MGIRLNKILKQLNVSTETVVEYLKSKPGLEPVKEMNPNTKVTDEWVFIAKNENYEACVNLMFDYFTDYTISAKRSSLRDADTNPPEMFKAEDYTFIDPNDLGQWLK